MKIRLTLMYSDIFSGEVPELDKLLEGIPSKFVINFLSLVNAYLFWEKEKSIFDDLFQRINVINRLQIKDFLNKENTSLFSIAATLRFIQYEMLNYRDIEEKDLTPAEELNIFKAYLILAEVDSQKLKVSVAKILDELTAENFFYKRAWPMMIYQYTINLKTNPFSQMLKTIIFFNHFLDKEEYNKVASSYIKQLGLQTIWDYVLLLMQILVDKNETSQYPKFSFKVTNDFIKFFERFCIRLLPQEGVQSTDFIDIRSKPLMKYSGNTFIVLYWSFFVQKIFDGFVYDFTNYSGIKNHPDFRKKSFKSYIGTEIGEKIIFRKITDYCFHDAKYTFKVYDEHGVDGFPDLYYREGINLFLIEFKDITISAQSIDNFDSSAFISEIEEKLFKNKEGKPKGIHQLINFINILNRKLFRGDSFLIDRQNELNVYPVIVYTDRMLSVPGVNKYFASKFKELKSVILPHSNFKKVNDVVFINIDFFINNCRELKSKEIRLHELIKKYISAIDRREKQRLKDSNIDRFHSIYMCFEDFLMNKKDFKKHKKDIDILTIKELIREFSLTNHLPKG